MALLFTATYPDRAQALVLYGTFARCSQAPGYPIGVSPEEADAFIDLVAREWTLAVPMGGSTSSTSPTPRRALLCAGYAAAALAAYHTSTDERCEPTYP